MGIFNNLSPKAAFWGGLLASVGVASMIGFVVLLVMFVSQGSGFGGAAAANCDNPAAVVAPSPTRDTLDNASDVKLAPISSKDHVRGDENAEVTIVEFSDTECPFCKRFHSTMQQIVDEYDGRVRWVYKHFPLDSLHSKARKEAEATECAADQGGNDAFWKYLDRLMDITPSNNGLSLDELPAIAEYIGLDKSEFEDCLDSGKFASMVQAQVDEALAAGARGTPFSVIVAGEQIVPASGAMPFEQIKPMIDQLLK